MTFLTVDQKKKFDAQKSVLKKAKYLQEMYFNFIHFEEEEPQLSQGCSITIDVDDDSVVVYRGEDVSTDKSGIFSYMREKYCHCLYCGDMLLTKETDSTLYRSATHHTCSARQSVEVVNSEWREDLSDLDFVARKLHSLLARLRKVELSDRDAEFVRAFVMDVYQQSKVTWGSESIETIDNMIQCSLDSLILLRSPKNTQLAKVLSYCEDVLDICGVVYAPMSEDELNMTRLEFEEYLEQTKREVEETDMKNSTDRNFKLIKGGRCDEEKQTTVKPSLTRDQQTSKEQILYHGIDDDSFEVVAAYYGE